MKDLREIDSTKIGEQERQESHSNKDHGKAEVDFSSDNLNAKDLRGLNLMGVDLSGKNLREANLSGAKLFKANLQGADLSHAILRGAEMTGADLSDANLEEADLSNTGLGMANLKNARMFHSDLRNATLTGANLESADLRCADMRGTRSREIVLTKADLTSADLRSSDLSNAQVYRASFTSANLQRVTLFGVTGFETANWVGVDMHDINFSGAYLLRRFAMDQNYIKEFRERNRFSRFLYYLWWLTSDCGRSIVRWLSVIFFIAILFAGLYAMVDIEYGMAPQTWFTPFYFSIITMTTLGYGDVLPISITAQMLVVIQVLVGYIMLGGLLSIFANKLARRAE